MVLAALLVLGIGLSLILDYQTAMVAISEVPQQHMQRVIKELPSPTSKVAIESLLLKAFWDALPEEFEAKDFKTTALEGDLPIPTAERYTRQQVDARLDKAHEDDTESDN